MRYTTGKVAASPPMPQALWGGVAWADLDAFTQGYITAAFFTEQGDGTPGEEDASGLWVEVEPGLWSNELGFADLAPETLAATIADCQAFQQGAAFRAWTSALEDGGETADGDGVDGWLDRTPGNVDEKAGRDFWYTRNGHGCGFWDGDWPEPYASELTKAAKAFGEVSLILGDDGKIHCE